jgi:hypothetical protein
MPERKYEHLVKPLSVGGIGMDMEKMKNADVPEGGFSNGPGNADKIVWLNGRDHLEGLALNFTWGFYSGIGDWHTGQDPHVHPYPECLVFVGLDSANLNYLGAEIEICLGEEQETYTFDEPTVVIAPAGFQHCPLITKRVFSPKGFGFFLASLGAEPETTWMGDGISEDAVKMMRELAEKEGFKMPMKSHVAKERVKKNPTRPTGKYAHLVKPLKSGIITRRGELDRSRLTPEELANYDEMKKKGEMPGPGSADHLTWMYGRDLEGLNMNFSWAFYSKPGIWRRGAGAHAHPAPEVLVFAGLNPEDIDYLGAQIEIELGEEHERYIIEKPTAVICPAGMPHTPVVTRWADRPFAFYTITLSGDQEIVSID